MVYVNRSSGCWDEKEKIKLVRNLAQEVFNPIDVNGDPLAAVVNVGTSRSVAVIDVWEDSLCLNNPAFMEKALKFGGLYEKAFMGIDEEFEIQRKY